MTLLVKDCKEGMDVLLTDPDPMYDLGYSNPAVGTEAECIGTISSVSGIIHVRWANGATNAYKDGELSAAYDGKFKSLWKELKNGFTDGNKDAEEDVFVEDIYFNFGDELRIDGDF